MITLQDCIALCGLNEAEVLAIAEHEHVPEVVAAGMAVTLLKRANGPAEVLHMIIDDIKAANVRGDHRHAAELLKCMKHFLDEYPQAATGGPSANPCDGD